MRIKLLENLIFESKEDIQRFVDKFGQDIYDRLQRNKQRILNKTKDPKTVDITWLVKNETLEGIEKILSIAEDVKLDIEGKPIPKPTNTKKLVFNGNGWKVYEIYDVEDMIDIGSDTGWCIAGKYQTSGTKVSQAVQYFPDYKRQLNLDCYYVITDGSTKECALVLKSGNIHSVWDKQDYKIDKDEYIDILKERGIPLKSIGMKDWSEEVFVWDGNSDIPKNVVVVEISDTVTDIESYAFSDRKNLISVYIPNSVNNIGDFAFYNCENLKDVNIPDSITDIGMYSFFNTGLTMVNIPNSVKSLGNSAFSACFYLSVAVISDGVKYVGSKLFDGCVNLSSVTLPNSIVGIPNGMFRNCKGLTSIKIPENAFAIRMRAFDSCHNLESIYIPSSVERIGTEAFKNCNNLSDVYFSGTKEQWDAIDIFNMNECLLDANIHFNS